MNPRRSIRRLLATLDGPAPRLHPATRIGIGLLIAVLSLDAVAAFVVSHLFFHFCPARMRHYPADGDIPIILGPPPYADADTVQRARRGEVVLGGFMLVPTAAAVCPFCRWPTRLYNPDHIPPPLDLDGGILAPLEANEAATVRLHALNLLRVTRREKPDRLTAAVITESDVWFGFWFAGLRRYDRENRQWHSLQPRSDAPARLRIPGPHIYRIWRSGDAIHVDHADSESPGYRRVHHTRNRGRSWRQGRTITTP